MKEIEVKKNLILTKKSIEDIYELGDYSLTPILSQMYHYLLEVDRLKVEDKKFDRLQSIVENNIDQLIEEFVSSLPNVQSKVISKNYSHMSHDRWEWYLETLHLVFEMAKLFPFSRGVNLMFGPRKIEITGPMDDKAGIKDIKDRCFEISNKLYKLKVLPLFKTIKSGDTECLKLIFDGSEDSHKIVEFDLFGRGNFNLGLNSFFESYRIKFDDLIDMGSHHCLYINDNFKLSKYRNAGLLRDEESDQFDCFYFPFLFRPISLIIPRKGVLKSLEDDDWLRLTGSVGKDQGRPRKSIRNNGIFFVDLFSLLN